MNSTGTGGGPSSEVASAARSTGAASSAPHPTGAIASRPATAIVAMRVAAAREAAPPRKAQRRTTAAIAPTSTIAKAAISTVSPRW
ncbi:MAG: hypothetical protein ACYTFH_10670 [Planctomycetota bacterium]|jgi:hypothetical protein